MRFFRRRADDDEPVDPEERSPQLGLKYKDLAVLGELTKAGADLSETRHVIFYSYAPSEEVARAMADEIRTRGFACEIREPLPEYPDQWSVVSEMHTVTSPDFIRDSTDFFEDVARRHGGEYDGWEASV